tara:strand:- start:8182 stop:8613 length:432 start_codon:yes stop_codon:yes gene_type:complete
MTKLKISLQLLFLILVVTPIGCIGYLNQSYFLQTSSLKLLVEKPINIDYTSPEITNVGYWVGCIFLTWLLINIVRLPKYFRIRKKINLLEEQISVQKIEIGRLLDGQKVPSPDEPTTNAPTGDVLEASEVVAVEPTVKPTLNP